MVQGFPMNDDTLDLMAEQGLYPFLLANDQETGFSRSSILATIEMEVLRYIPRNHKSRPSEQENTPFILFGGWQITWFVQFLQAFRECYPVERKTDRYIVDVRIDWGLIIL